MAIAPMHTVREAVTKPWMNWLSPPRSALAFSQAPSCSMRRSRSMNSPASAPRASARIMARVLPVPAEERTPFSAASIPARAPEAPMNRVASPRAFKIPSWQCSFRPPLASRPSEPPAIMARTLAMVPVPIMENSPCRFRYVL